ncbi:hypothetical protein BU24DRAFT_246140 [Aaosphaeria arxii CBS 175.79]|uniref:Uncharacterized protein n=1 Tax=Aaosphaeria arxii CBS 175.79 TaxID=1450172 RepID=A0A6A5XKG8_9PLEO|nr:uncharacterized protein BU24DRAFT_246140 [Aaosphaeria arxii CBS 175.79]KAF2013755.1 hypothetical protein BU24DRAFT_246140 [Aaosphaeria arxii CBS 175.79]
MSLLTLQVPFPHPSTMTSYTKEAESPRGDHILSNQLRSMDMDNVKYDPMVQLPSIEQLFGPLDVSRRLSSASSSTTSSSSSTSALASTLTSPALTPSDMSLNNYQQTATRRLNQIACQIAPYSNVSKRPLSKSARRTALKQGGPARARSSVSPDRPIKNIIKADREKGARKVQCSSLSKLQNALLFIKPELPHTAHGQGWKLLKSNNINWDIENALRHRKNDVLDSSTYMILQQHHLLLQIVQHLHQTGDASAASHFSTLIDHLCTEKFPELPPAFTANL